MEENSEKLSLLVFDEAEDLSLILEVLNKQLPLLETVPVDNLEKFDSALNQGSFDVVLIEQSLKSINILEILVKLKLADSEPAILVTSRTPDSAMAATLYNAGCHRCIVKEGHWLEEIVPALRHVLSLRRLERENNKLIAKLTEANFLLSDRNNRLDEFCSTVAHDIRGPLGTINMKLEYICDIYKDDVDERLSKLLLSTFESSKRLLGVVQSMYEFAKIGIKAAKKEMIDLKQLVDEVVQDLNFVDNSKVKVEVKALPSVWGCPHLLRKVFINLINNAVKYSDKEKTEIKIYEGLETKRSIGKFSEIIVEDNGAGIAKEDLNDLFVMFRRGRNADKKCDGSGIGLSVVKQIVELHYGTASVESEVGRGSKFIITLPLEEIKLV